jgi:CRISPR-associated endonuclease Csn1
MKLLGLDIGSNSVGSAWVDTNKKIIQIADSVFPAGVEESDKKRGVPKNQARRGKRSQRRSIERRAKRKHLMRKFLLEQGWIPKDMELEKKWLENVKLNPWTLRAQALDRPLKPLEFGRILLHMVQRRGGFGWDIEEDELTETAVKLEGIEDENEELDQKAKTEHKLKDAVKNTRSEMKRRNARTFGELMTMIIKDKERVKTVGEKKKEIHFPIRNRTSAAGDPSYELCADRQLAWDEFDKIWRKQKSFDADLSKQLTDDCRKKLDDPQEDTTWQYKGILFGQRKTYWDLGTLGRCDLEPTDMRCSKVDMYAQEFLVLETLNNIRITPPGEIPRRLDEYERKKVLEKLKIQKTAKAATVREALDIHKGINKTKYSLSLDKDPKRGLNTWWFFREIIAGAIGETAWDRISEMQKESINKAILKFDPTIKKDEKHLTEGCRKWWGFNEGQTKRFIEAWKKRIKTDLRVNYSRRAIKKLLPYMRDGWTVNEARKLFVEDATNGATDEERKRYDFGSKGANRAMRQYIVKHSNSLTPAPILSNPVVRKTIHEVRKHVQEWIRKFGCKPDRIVVELVREARQSAKVRNRQLKENREREEERKKIIEKYHLDELTRTQRGKAIKRVLLCREQKFRCAYGVECGECAYCADMITEEEAAKGTSVELDHIIPESRGGENFLNNLVLCHTKCNRGKGNKTPKEWLTEEQFERLEQNLGYLKEKDPVKWANLHKEGPEVGDFIDSQLKDTAYAARQVVSWLRDALYNGDAGRVFAIGGNYTALLRGDWQLFPDKDFKASADKDEIKKNRADHRHHALDAVVIALSQPEQLQKLARAFERMEKGEVAKREPLEPPWGNRDSFRKQVMERWENLIVSHRHERRRIAGEFHKDEHFGAIEGDEKHFTKRIFAGELTPNHLRVPKSWEELRQNLEKAKSESEKRRIQSQMLAIEDVKPEKSGIVRDRWFREELRDCLRRNGLNPDSPFKTDPEKRRFKNQLKEIVKSQGLLLKSGVPVRRITLLRTLSDPVKILRKQFDPKTGKMIYDENPSSLRIYDSQNNHHIEIRENKRGKWKGEVITNFDAVKRVKPHKRSGLRPQPAVNRADTEKGKFVMSLSIGEMINMKHPETGKADYFVVFKIDGNGTIHFTPHWDAGRDKEKDKCPAREDLKLPGKKTGGLSATQLENLGVEEGKPPQKVWVGPLGDVKVLTRD